MTIARVARLLAAAGLIAALSAPAVIGYQGEVAGTVTVTPPEGRIQCRTEAPVSATILNKDGQPIADTTVTWKLTTIVSSQDSIVNPTTTTDANGVATTRVWLDCIAGDRRIEARVGEAFGGAVLGVTGVGVGLPNTSTDASAGTPAWALAIAGAAVLVGAILGLRTIVARR